MILLTGGSGLLGTELQKHIECYAPSHNDFDILNPSGPPKDTHLVVHCAAYTDVAMAEHERQTCWDANVIGTKNIANLGIPMVYISTEYIFGGGKGNYSVNDAPDPTNYYAMSKLMGEGMCLLAPASLIIRCVFKSRPFEHPQACTDQWTSGDYVDVIAPMIASLIQYWNRQNHSVIHVGTGRKSTYDLAKQSNPHVKPCLRSDIRSVKLPMDTSLAQEWKGSW